MMDNSKPILLSTAYLPPIQYISKFLANNEIVIEAHEHFEKQSFRNRCIISSANGTEHLSIPIVKGSSKQAVQDVRISYDTQWQHIHWNAIVSAYNSSPFFDILRHDFEPFFKKQYSFLLDFNTELLSCILDILEVNAPLNRSHEFELSPANKYDLRNAMHPKESKAQPDAFFSPKAYSQVFEHKFGFTPNLSIIDLLFNTGSMSYEILLKSCTG